MRVNNRNENGDQKSNFLKIGKDGNIKQNKP